MKNLSIKTAICAMAMVASSAFAGPGLASESDVTLGGFIADDFAYAEGVNPQGNGPKGGTTGFEAAFAQPFSTPWERIAKTSSAPYTFEYPASLFNGVVSFTLNVVDGQNGTWSMTNLDAANDLTMDLVFAMHVGGGSGAWLFDDQFIGAGETLMGTWTNKMVNGTAGSVTSYSNLTFFGRDLVKVPNIEEVPEPATLGTLALGLGMIGWMRRRQQK